MIEIPMYSDLLVDIIQTAFQIFNSGFFSNKLPNPQIVVDLSKKFSLRYVFDQEEPVLIVGSDFQELSEPHEFLICLLHQMVHMYNVQIGRPDYGTGAGAYYYHNKYFAGLATEVGLFVLKHKSQGFSITTTDMPRNVTDEKQVRIPDIRAIERRNSIFAKVDLQPEVFEEARLLVMEQVATLEHKNFFLKYTCKCPPPHNSIRSGRRPDGPHPLQIMCKECGADFVCEKFD